MKPSFSPLRWFLKLTVWTLNRLPRPVALKAGEAAGSFIYFLAERTKLRGKIANTVRTAFPDYSEKQAAEMARRHVRDLFKTVVEAARFRELPRLLQKGHIQVEGEEHLRRVLEQGNGAVLLSAHYGNWELLISVMGLLGFPVHAVVVKQSYAMFNRWLVRERERFGSKVVFIEDMSSARAQELLARNQLIFLLADHHHYGKKARNVVRFFGDPVSVPGGPVAYSTRFGAPLVPVRAVRSPGSRHRIIVEPPLELVDTGQSNQDFLENCQRYIAHIEGWIRERPDQWMWSHERWAWLDENLESIDAPPEPAEHEG